MLLIILFVLSTFTPISTFDSPLTSLTQGHSSHAILAFDDCEDTEVEAETTLLALAFTFDIQLYFKEFISPKVFGFSQSSLNNSFLKHFIDLPPPTRI